MSVKEELNAPHRGSEASYYNGCESIWQKHNSNRVITHISISAKHPDQHVMFENVSLIYFLDLGRHS